MKPIFVCLALASLSPIMAQETGQKNSFEFTTFRFEQNSQTRYHVPEPKFVTGLIYERAISRLSWTNGLEYGVNSFKDEAFLITCQPQGKVHFKEFSAFSGLKFTFGPKEISKLKFFLESRIYYAYIYSKGAFNGGFGGTPFARQQSDYAVGGQVRTGIMVQLIPRVYLSVASAFRCGYASSKIDAGDYEPRFEWSSTLGQIGFGIRF